MSLINKNKGKIKIHTCRICLDANSSDMISIEEQNGWLSLFKSCFGFTLTTQDVPRLLCQSCAEKVQNYVKFKKKCLESHNLWKLVISDVKCCVVKHQNVENFNDPAINETEIKEEISDISFESEHYFDNGDNEIKFSPRECKMETLEDDTKSRIEENNAKKKDYLVKNTIVHGDGSVKKMDQGIYSNSSLNEMKKLKYTCSKCRESYDRKYWYDRHKELCHTERRKLIYSQEYSYDLGRKYDDQNTDIVKQEPQNNIEIINNENDSLFSCGLCYLSFANAQDCFKHLGEHWSSNVLACKLCGFVGIDLAAIVSHRYSHMRRSKLRFVCHICEKHELSLIALHFHYRKEHLKKPGGYCSRCNKEYTKLRYWKKHMRSHVGPKFTCDICKKEFIYKSNLRLHMIDHMRLDKCICDICGKVLSRQRYIKWHKKTVHNETGPIKCTHCNRMFKSEYSFTEHQKNIAKEKKLKCEVCHKGFRTPNMLKLHMISHSDEKPFSCELCGHSYKRKSHLLNHLQQHSGMSPECQICMKRFATSGSLKRHSAVHTGVRRYSCPATNCERSFHQKKQMLAHLQLRHKNEILEKNEILQENDNEKRMILFSPA